MSTIRFQFKIEATINITLYKGPEVTLPADSSTSTVPVPQSTMQLDRNLLPRRVNIRMSKPFP